MFFMYKSIIIFFISIVHFKSMSPIGTYFQQMSSQLFLYVNVNLNQLLEINVPSLQQSTQSYLSLYCYNILNKIVILPIL